MVRTSVDTGGGKAFRPVASTVHVYVTDMVKARVFYAALFDREPDFVPEPDTCEWEIHPGAWLLVACSDPDPGLRSGRIRFGVANLNEARRRVLRELGVSVTAADVLPDVVTWCNFEDPWGNRLGLFEDLSSS